MKLIKVLGGLVIVLISVIVLALAVACLVYPPQYVYRVLVWQDSDAFDWQKFPSHHLNAAPTAYHFDEALDPRVAELFERLSGADD